MGYLKLCAILLCFVVTLVFSQNVPSLDWQFDPYSTDQWFKQKLDHYDAGSIQFWPQRYVTSYRFYRLGGPVFIYLSGPGPELTLDDIESGAIAAYAEEQGAFVIGLEHRYYGKSRPTQDLSTENLKYLTVPQTIEDIASFVRSWKTRAEFRNNKLVIFGASYLGSIAAWFAQKHPELLDAFVSSSAPLELRYEIPEFLQGIGSILNQTDPKCYETIEEGFSCLEHVISEQGCENYTLADIKTKFELCAELDTSNAVDVTGIFAELFSTVSSVVMYHNPDPASFPDTNLGRFCKHITTENDKTALEKIGEKVKEINTHRGLSCSEFRFQTTVDFLDDKDWDSPAAKDGYRQLQFQLCNELGWTVASSNISQPFGHFLSPFLHSEVCKKLFSFSETEMRLKVLQANNDLKGKALTTKCGIFVNGDHDPWHTFSISRQEEAGQCNRAILIKGGSHGRDVEEFTNTPSHPAEVRDAQLQIARYLDTWLKTGKCCDEASESRKVISTYSRSTRAPNSKEYYRFVNNIHQPNVQIKPHAYPFEEGEKLIASPTSIPYQVSTTDVLSVSPRIPIASQDQEDGDMYRDPRNIELRRYRVVKLLRHRPSFAPPTYESSMTPSMEQFEADFPEHRLRVEGRVERVFKNGSKISDNPQSYTQIQSPRPDIESQQPLEQERNMMVQTDPTEPVPQTPDSMNSENKSGLENNNNRFRYVVKQIFRNVEDVENAKETEEKQVTGNQDDGNSVGVKELEELENMEKNAEVSSSPKQTTKRQQSLEDIDIDEVKKMGEKESTESSLLETDSQDRSSEIRKRESSEESASKSSVSSSEENYSLSGSESDDNSSATTKPIASKKKKYSDESSGGEILVKVSTKTKPKPKEDTEEERDESDSEQDDDDGFEDDYDDYYDDDDKDDESNETHHSGLRRSRTNNTNKTQSGTDLSSGEGGRPRRLREKISEKIMSSSEEFEGAQKSKEKTSSKNSKNGRQSKQKADDKSSDDDSFEDLDSSSSSSSSSSSEEYDDDDDNYSLEPSGSNTQKVYRKKQLTPIAKAAIEEPATVINVEISGSYPRRSRKRKAKKVAKLSSDEQIVGKGVEKETKQPRPRRVHRRRRPSKVKPIVNETENSNAGSSTAPTTSTTISTSTPFSTTTTANETPGSNNYAAWNKLHKQVIESEAKPLQEEPPRIVSLDEGRSSESPGLEPPTQNENGEGVTYIIIGDIPDENGNSIGDNPSNDALFSFIQKLVSRHSSAGIFAHHRPNLNLPASIPPPPPPPPPPTPPPTTTTTEAPQLSPFQNGFHHAGKYLLVRPVQVVPLGREQVVHAHDLRNDSFVDLMTMETPLDHHPYQDLTPQKTYPYQTQSIKRQNNNQYGGYRFKSPFHREHFEKLLSVDDQVRDSDRDEDVREAEAYQHSQRRLDEIPDPSWRSIRGISQFGPVVPPQKATSGLLSLTAADTMWVNDGVPFIPRNRQFRSSHRTGGFN